MMGFFGDGAAVFPRIHSERSSSTSVLNSFPPSLIRAILTSSCKDFGIYAVTWAYSGFVRLPAGLPGPFLPVVGEDPGCCCASFSASAPSRFCSKMAVNLLCGFMEQFLSHTPIIFPTFLRSWIIHLIHRNALQRCFLESNKAANCCLKYRQLGFF